MDIDIKNILLKYSKGGNVNYIDLAKSGIKIKKSNKGKFTEYCGGKVTDECIQKAKKSENPILRKRATFAQNSRSWSEKHFLGGAINIMRID